MKKPAVLAALTVMLIGSGLAFHHTRVVGAQQAATMTLQPDGPTFSSANVIAPVVPTKLSQLTNDVGLIGFAPFNVSFPASSLLAIGTYGPISVTVPSAVMGQAVECNITNFQSTAYKSTGIVPSTGSASVTLTVTTPLATNATAPLARCFTY